jgi:hypothetical protein
LSQNITLHHEWAQKQNPNTYRPLLTPNPLQKTIIPTETPNNNTSHSHHHNRAKLQYSFRFHYQSILGLSQMTPKQAKKLESTNFTPDLESKAIGPP